MKVRIQVLREAGRVLKRSELPEPVEGVLAVEDWPADAGSRHKRNRRFADLRGAGYGVAEHHLIAKLWDPEMVKIDAAGMYLQGCEAAVVDGVIHEYVQVWLVKAV